MASPDDGVDPLAVRSVERTHVGSMSSEKSGSEKATHSHLSGAKLSGGSDNDVKDTVRDALVQFRRCPLTHLHRNTRAHKRQNTRRERRAQLSSQDGYSSPRVPY